VCNHWGSNLGAKEVNHAYLQTEGIHVPLEGNAVVLFRVELVNPVEGVILPIPFHGDNTNGLAL
jgi:hypothetical protein